MKSLLTAMLVSTIAGVATANATSTFEGRAFEVDVYSDTSRAPTRMCIGFEAGGRFTMSNAPHSMRWDVEVADKRSFLAVTEPTDRVVLPYHMAVYGTLRADGLLVGSGIDEFGGTFRFVGSKNADCFDAESGIHADAAKAANPVDIRYRSAGFERPRVPNPCYVYPDLGYFCDPVPNPLSDTAKAAGAPGLAGRSFRLTLGSSGYATRDYCWTFGSDATIETVTTGEHAWTSGAADKGFLSVGAGLRALGIGYRGQLVDTNLLHVTGIEARNGRSVVTSGYGQAVDSCK